MNHPPNSGPARLRATCHVTGRDERVEAPRCGLSNRHSPSQEGIPLHHVQRSNTSRLCHARLQLPARYASMWRSLVTGERDNFVAPFQQRENMFTKLRRILTGHRDPSFKSITQDSHKPNERKPVPVRIPPRTRRFLIPQPRSCEAEGSARKAAQPARLRSPTGTQTAVLLGGNWLRTGRVRGLSGLV